MRLNDLIDQLNYGELKHVKLGKETDDLPELLAHVHLGLIDLHTRFLLRTNDVIVQCYDHIETYTLDRRYAATNKLSPEPYKYIIDSEFEPFDNDVIRIEEVFNEGGETCFLNDRSQPWSLYTPAYNQVQIPFPHYTNSMVVHYRARPLKIGWQPGMDTGEVEVEIPEALVPALLLYVASRALPNTDQEGEKNTAFQKYLGAVAAAEKYGVDIKPHPEYDRFDANGWV
jgi:hypothetical protein